MRLPRLPRPALPRLLLTGLSAMLAAGCGLLGEKPPPNVILIVVDTLRQDHLGYGGYPRPTSPAIDELAATGTRYVRAYSQAPWTTPSIGSLLTSRFPTELGITQAPDRLDDRFVLLSEVLADQGYATGAVVSHYFVSSKWNFNQGFTVFDESNIQGHAAVTSPGVTETALRFVEAHREEPFFLFVHYFDPHYDYIEHRGHRFSSSDYAGPVTSGMVYTDLLGMLPSLTEVDRGHLLDLYDSEVAFTDAHLGRFLHRLGELDLFDPSLVVFTADHGEEFLERGAIGHGGTLFNEVIHVPLIIKLPGQRQGGIVETEVGLIDVYPTILEALGLPAEHEISGRSFFVTEGEDGGEGASTSGTEPRPRLVFSETDWSGHRSVVWDRHKLIHHLPSDTWAFFDLAADPGERELLTAKLHIGDRLGRYRYLEEKLNAWMALMERRAGESTAVEITEEERRQLEALGYLN